MKSKREERMRAAAAFYGGGEFFWCGSVDEDVLC